jgi:hypothetical protein
MALGRIQTGIRVAVLGHSFIRRLHEDFKQNSYPANYDLEECSVVHFGIGGFRVCDGDAVTYFSSKFGDFLRQVEPNIVLLQLGGNDVDSVKSSLDIANRIEEITALIIQEYAVEKVVVCEIFTRARPTKVTSDLFEHKRLHSVSILQTLLDMHDKARFWKHRRLFYSQTPIFRKDGIHLNHNGQRRFYRSLRHAIMSAVRSVIKDRS